MKTLMHRERGHTLPELLIGLTLGLLVIAAATRAYGVSKQSWTTMVAADAVHANARMAMRNVQEQAKVAGASYLEAAPDNTVRIFTTEITGQPAIAGINGSKAIESLTLGHWRALDALDCQGNTASTQVMIRNDYKLNTNKELTCKDLDLPGSTYQALAEGVEDFQVRYAQANPAANTLQWLNADQVTSMPQVVAVEICLRIASTQVVNSTKTSNTSVTSCSDEPLLSDGRLRRVFKRVIALRNREGVMP
jgi:type IV pilus assembly protein PilW